MTKSQIMHIDTGSTNYRNYNTITSMIVNKIDSKNQNVSFTFNLNAE